MVTTRWALASWLLLATSSSHAGDAWTADAESCIAGGPRAGLDIQLCSYVIRKGHEQGASKLSLSALYSARGSAQMRLYAPRQAIDDYQRALALNPASASTWQRNAIAERDLEQFDSALRSLGKAIELSPFDSAGWRERGYTRLTLGDYPGAQSDLDRAIGLAPLDPGSRALRGIVHYLSARWHRAGNDFDHAEQLALAYDYLPVWQVLTRMRAGAEYPERTPSLSAEMNFLDGQQWPHVLLSHLAGDTPFEAVVAVAQGGEKKVGHPEAFFYLAELALIRNDPKRAREYLEYARSREIRTAERYLARLRIEDLARLGTGASAR